MIDWNLDIDTWTEEAAGTVETRRRQTGRNVWVVVSPAAALEDVIDIDRQAPAGESDTRVCHAVLAGGALVLGTPDPEQEERIRSLLSTERCGRA